MGRKRGSRFRKVIDAQEQLEQIEKAQRDARQGKIAKKIERTDKSKQRLANSLRRIRTESDAPEEFE